MHLLITSAFALTSEEQHFLSRFNTLHFLPDEGIPMSCQKIDFDPVCIEGIVCNFFFLHNDLDCLPNLRFIQLTSVGMDRVPLDQIYLKGISLYNVGDAYAIPMAEWAVCKLLELTKHSRIFYDHQKQHVWIKDRNIHELAGQNTVIVGFGNVGRQIAKRLKAFDAKITAVDIVPAHSTLYDDYFHIDELASAVQTADILILTLPLSEQTHHIISKKILDLLNPQAIIINVARGGLIDQAALINKLICGELYGAALDVFEEEPLTESDPIWDCPRLLISPHNSFISIRNHDRLFDKICKNLKDHQKE